MGKLWLADNTASSAESEAYDKLFDTTPTTIQGLLALLAYVRTNDFLSESLNNFVTHLTQLFESSLSKIAGLPKPPSWFDGEDDEEEA